MRRLLCITSLWLALCSPANAETIKTSVNGMVCAFCATGIEKSFKQQPAVQSVNVDLDNRLVTVETKKGQTLDDATCTKLITDAGFSVVSIQRAN